MKALEWLWFMFQRKLLGRSDIWFNGSRYMRRWLFMPKHWWGLRVHCIERSDEDRELHDHPFDFWSLIISGGYWEWRPCDDPHCETGMHRAWRGPLTLVKRRAEDLHRIELLVRTLPPCGQDKPAWTIVLRSPYYRPWGFMTKDGWKHWAEFTRERDGRGEAAGKYATKSSL